MTQEYLEELIAKYANGTATDEEINALMRWYHHSHPGEVKWPSTSGDEKELVYERVLSKLQKEIQRPKTIIPHFQWMKAAAIFLLVVGIATIVYLLKPSSLEYLTINNPGGKTQKIELPDGTNVWLNAATSIRYNAEFSSNRYVYLEGEAYFDVKHDAAHPFRIKAGETENTVLGTRFNIEAYESSRYLIVSLISGKLQVDRANTASAVLIPMQQITFDRSLSKTETKFIDTSSVLSWMKGSLDFQGQSLADISLELERWFGVEIELASSISSCRYYVSFDNDLPLEKILQSMAEISNIKYTIQHKNVRITGDSCN